MNASLAQDRRCDSSSHEVTYGLAKPGRTDVVCQISQQRYDVLIQAATGMVGLREIEERFNLLAANYLELEEELLRLTLRRSISLNNHWASIVDDISTINRRLANLLTTTRLYRDQTTRILRSLYGEDSRISTWLRERREEISKGNFGFRLLEQLRNFIQHRSIPVLGVDFPIKRNADPGARGLQWSIEPYVTLDDLRRDPKISKDLLNTLAEYGDRIVITPFVRQYMQGLSWLNGDLREQMRGDRLKWCELLTGALSSFAPDGEQIEWLILTKTEQSKTSESAHIFKPLLNRYEELVSRNINIGMTANQYVSGASPSIARESDDQHRTD